MRRGYRPVNPTKVTNGNICYGDTRWNIHLERCLKTVKGPLSKDPVSLTPTKPHPPQPF